MSSTNYIRHLSCFYEKIMEDTKLNPSHVSLYLALFQLWNTNRFINPFFVNKGDAMRLSKIGSRSTYQRCIRDLDTWKYIKYQPSQNPLKSSQIHLTKFDPSTGLVVSQVVGQALVSFSKHNKQIETYKEEAPTSKNEVVLFFKEKKWSVSEAEKFYNYYQALDWKINGNKKIKKWKPVAENWMLKAAEFERNRTNKNQDKDSVFDITDDHLKVSNNKNYNEPL